MYMCLQAHTVVTDSASPQTVACQVHLSIEFFRQEHWSGLSFPPPGDPFHPGMEPGSPASPALVGGFFTTALPGKLGKPRGIFRNQKKKKKSLLWWANTFWCIL